VSAGLRELIASHNDIESVRGLHIFANLRVLDLSDNNIARLDETQLPKGLRSLNVAGNLLVSIDFVASLQGLATLDVSRNALQTVVLRGGRVSLPLLVELRCSDNVVVDVSGIGDTYPSLETLDVARNPCVDFDPAARHRSPALTGKSSFASTLRELRDVDLLRELTVGLLDDAVNAGSVERPAVDEDTSRRLAAVVAALPALEILDGVDVTLLVSARRERSVRNGPSPPRSQEPMRDTVIEGTSGHSRTLELSAESVSAEDFPDGVVQPAITASNRSAESVASTVPEATDVTVPPQSAAQQRAVSDVADAFALPPKTRVVVRGSRSNSTISSPTDPPNPFTGTIPPTAAQGTMTAEQGRAEPADGREPQQEQSPTTIAMRLLKAAARFGDDDSDDGGVDEREEEPDGPATTRPQHYHNTAPHDHVVPVNPRMAALHARVAALSAELTLKRAANTELRDDIDVLEDEVGGLRKRLAGQTRTIISMKQQHQSLVKDAESIRMRAGRSLASAAHRDRSAYYTEEKRAKSADRLAAQSAAERRNAERMRNIANASIHQGVLARKRDAARAAARAAAAAHTWPESVINPNLRYPAGQAANRRPRSRSRDTRVHIDPHHTVYTARLRSSSDFGRPSVERQRLDASLAPTTFRQYLQSEEGERISTVKRTHSRSAADNAPSSTRRGREEERLATSSMSASTVNDLAVQAALLERLMAASPNYAGDSRNSSHNSSGNGQRSPRFVMHDGVKAATSAPPSSNTSTTHSQAVRRAPPSSSATADGHTAALPRVNRPPSPTDRLSSDQSLFWTQSAPTSKQPRVARVQDSWQEEATQHRHVLGGCSPAANVSLRAVSFVEGRWQN
jgi:hypothetical protein